VHPHDDEGHDDGEQRWREDQKERDRVTISAGS
jgi:hypothetical protein